LQVRRTLSAPSPFVLGRMPSAVRTPVGAALAGASPVAPPRRRSTPRGRWHVAWRPVADRFSPNHSQWRVTLRSFPLADSRAASTASVDRRADRPLPLGRPEPGGRPERDPVSETGHRGTCLLAVARGSGPTRFRVPHAGCELQVDLCRSLDLKALIRRRVRCDRPAFPLDVARCSLGLRPSRAASTGWLPCFVHIVAREARFDSGAEAPGVGWARAVDTRFGPRPVGPASRSERRVSCSSGVPPSEDLRAARPCGHPVTRPVPPP
jgi:hypothetical protein